MIKRLVEFYKLHKEEIGLTTLVLLLLYFSTDSMLFGANHNKKYIYIGYLVLITLAFIVCVFMLIRKTEIKAIPLFLTMSLCLILIINSAFLFDLSGGILVKVCLLCFSFYVVNQYSLRTFFKCFRNAMFIFAIISLIPFIISYIKLDFFSFLPTIQNTAGNNYYTGYLFNILVTGKREYMRNYGIFREPGFYQVLLSFALLFEILLEEKPKLFRIFTFIIVMITTFSVSAILSLGLLFVVYLFTGYKRFGKKIFNISLISLCVLIGAFWLLYVLHMLDGLTFFATDKTISYQTRISSIIVNIRVLLDNFIFGAGLTNFGKEISGHMGDLVSDGGNTPTILINFSMHGFFYGLVMLIALIAFIKLLCINKKWYVFVTVLLLIVTNLIAQSLVYNFVYYALTIYGAEYLFKFIKNKFFIVKEKD